MNLYTETGKFIWKKETIQHLGVVSFGGDIRLFNGEVPSWPEAELAKEWGQKVSEKYGLTFYFPSHTEPDNDCPSWPQRHLAINCEDCGKSIIPTDSPYLPKEICYHCHLNREQNVRIKLNEFYKDGVYGIYQINGNTTNLRDFSIPLYLHELVKLENVNKENGIIKFDTEKLLSIKNQLYQEIKSNLTNYKKSDLQGDRRKFGSFEIVAFDGIEYEFESQFNENHRTLSSLIYRYSSFEQAAAQNWTYYLHIVKGVTNRDDSFLRFINFVSKGSTNLNDINNRYKNILTETEIFATLKKLEGLGCIDIENHIFKITERGQAIL
ncbi:MAG: hypothetical protein EOO44_06380 [Flavobacterium sp.]|nr:MAG: hypothetical protein EOO44_06380 [Flavobacterium sp.]